jgi:hypothetical protein
MISSGQSFDWQSALDKCVAAGEKTDVQQNRPMHNRLDVPRMTGHPDGPQAME